MNYATVDELGITIHFVKDGTILSPDSKSSEKFIHTASKVLMARNCRRKDNKIGDGTAVNEIWLPTLDAFRTFAAEYSPIPGILSTISSGWTGAA
jgi:hypothetical protein